MSKSVRINIFGGPGVGKSTVAAFLYNEMYIKYKRFLDEANI